MTFKFKPGEPVKLTDKFAATLMRRRTASSRWKVDWKTRCGAVYSCNSHDVLILWDGRKTFDSYPIAAVELIAAKASQQLEELHQ